jgi:hypothetical protein
MVSKADLTTILVQMLDSVLDERSAIYAAGPLDSGLLYYETLSRREPTIDVRSVNQRRLTQFAQELRKEQCSPVIDPGILRIDGWTGSDHGDFFLKVVERYVRYARFVDGWQYSTGATKEFFLCIARGIPCLDQAGREIDTTEGYALVQAAIDHIDQLGVDSSTLRSCLPSI